MAERELSEHEKRFRLKPLPRRALLEDIFTEFDWAAVHEESSDGGINLTGLELMNLSIVLGGRIGTHGSVYAATVEMFDRDRRSLFGGLCALCRGESEETQIDHLWPVSRFPELVVTLENLAPACRFCNAVKGSRDPSRDELAFVALLTGFPAASPIEWAYRPTPPLESMFVDDLPPGAVTETGSSERVPDLLEFGGREEFLSDP